MEEHHEFFRQLIEQYGLEFQSAVQVGQGWRISTNKGDKRLSHFSSQQQLALSHDWREYLAENGHRYVERYLVTKVGKREIEDATGRYVVSDYWEVGDECGEKKKRWEGYYDLGRVIGKTHFFFEARGEEENVFPGLQKKGMISRIRFESLYEFLQGISQGEKSWSHSIKRFLSTNLPLLAERIHKAELFYQSSLEGPSRFSFSQFPLEFFCNHKEKWYVIGNHHPLISPLHEDTFSLLIEINQREKGDLKGIERFLNGYLAERDLSRKEWDFLCSMFIFPWGVMERLYALLKQKNPDEILPEEMTAIFAKQIEQEGILQFIAHWADSRGGVSI